ncbi:MAG: septum formation initiator family protein [Chloroflexota bacterium]
MAVEKGKRPERKRTGQLSGLQIMFAAILAIGLILGLNFTSLIASGQPLQELYQQVNGEIDKLQQEQSALIQERDFAQSDAFVAQWARSEGKMVMPGEVLVVPVPSGAQAEATAAPEPTVEIETRPPEPEPWQVWWAMFFDSPPPKF